MTFSAMVKNELVNSINYSSCCAVPTLSALILSTGTIEVMDGIVGFSITSNNISIAEVVVQVVDKLFEISVEVEKSTKNNNSTYGAWVYDGLEILYKCGIAYVSDTQLKLCDGVDKDIVKKDCCAKAYLRAMFIGCGTVIVPKEKSTSKAYHMEFALTRMEFALDILDLLRRFGFESALTVRKGQHIVYIKDSEEISDVLAFLGAGKSVLELQNIIIERSVRNKANRQTNCILANIDKTQQASDKQIQAINKLAQAKVLVQLNEKLREVASLRQSYPTESLDELVTILGGSISKSGLNHRLRKLVELANELDK